MDDSWAPALRLKEGCGAAVTARRPSPIRIQNHSLEPTAPPGDDIVPDTESEKMEDQPRTVMDEVRRALHAAMHEEWECKLRRLLGEELMVMRMDVLQRQQQLQQMQFAEHLRAVKMMLEEHQREEAGPPAEVAAPAKEVSPRKGRSESPVKVTRSQARHHTWHNQSSSCSPGKQAERSSLLKLPAESLRTVVRATQAARSPIRFADDKSATPSARAAALAAAAMRSEKEAASAASRNASPIHSPNTREDDIESRSARSEENEKWKQNWTRQMRARLSSQLGDLGHGPSKKKTKGAVTRSMSKFIGADASARHRQTLAQMYQVHPPKTKLEQLVDGTAFQLAVGFIIFANAVFIGIMTDVSMQNVMATPPQGDPSWFHLVNQIFVGMFVAEVLIRLIAKRLDFVYGIDWKWNIFDFCLASYCLAEELLTGFSITYTRLLRGFRMVRVLRVIRVMRLFRELRLMVCSIIQSMVSLSWALLLLLLIMYLFTIIFMHGATLYFQDDSGKEDVRHSLQAWFGSVGRSMYSLLLAVTGGEDWYQIAEPLGDINWLYQILFAFYVLFVVIGVLNVLTSAFVQRACELSRLDRDLAIQSELVSDESFVAEMKSIFEEVDAEGTGCIDWEQFRSFIHNEHVQAYFATQQLDTSDARELFNLLDQDGDGEVYIEEFILGCKKLRGQAKSSDVATLLRESKKANSKSMRAMRKLEERLIAICNGFQGLGIVIPEDSRWMGSPSSCRSYARSVISRSRSRRILRGTSVSTEELDKGIKL